MIKNSFSSSVFSSLNETLLAAKHSSNKSVFLDGKTMFLGSLHKKDI